jgi:arylsulfatase A-like enzyme
LLVVTALAVYLHVALEWLFFVTKPSFMETMMPSERVRLLLTAPLLIVVVLVPVAGLCWLLAAAFRMPWLLSVGRAIPTAVLACCGFVLLDNFTYTVLGFGVVSAGGVTRYLYLALLLGLFAWLYRGRPGSTMSLRAGGALTGCLFAASSIATGWQLVATPSPPTLPAQHGPAARRLPNIIIVGTDGVEASHLPTYGYGRNTTPFLARLARTGLVFENAFPNANSSAGSLTALITGKFPLKTHLLQYPDILRGGDAYQHLPGVLKGLGYRSIAMSTPNYVDPFNANMENSFDVANLRARRRMLPSPTLPPRLALALAPPFYFLGEIEERLTTRVLHAAGVRDMTNAFAAVTAGAGWSDQLRIDTVLDFLAQSQQPVFAHLHLMTTHVPHSPTRPIFSAGLTKDPGERARRRVDLYDDVIAEFDRHLQRLVEGLEQQDKLANTVLVITSDHGWRWTFARLPLVFVFPGGTPRGRRSGNVQLIDVAPTLLDYIGAPIPPWMDGRSLLHADLDPARAIMSVQVRSRNPAPFSRIGAVGATICRRTFWLDPHAASISWIDIPASTATCSGLEVAASESTARAMILSALRDNGYDVSSLKHVRRVPPPPAVPSAPPEPAVTGSRAPWSS